MFFASASRLAITITITRNCMFGYFGNCLLISLYNTKPGMNCNTFTIMKPTQNVINTNKQTRRQTYRN